MTDEEHMNPNTNGSNASTSLADHQSAAIVHPETTESTECVVVISNLPKFSHTTKVEKLPNVELKMMSKIGSVQTTDTYSGCLMPKDENGTSLGLYCFVEHEKTRDAVLEGNKNTILSVNLKTEDTTERTAALVASKEEEGGMSPAYDSGLDPLSILLQTRLWSRNPAVVATALQTMADLCDKEKCNGSEVIKDNRRAVDNGAGGFAIPVAMKNNYSDVNVQIAGCRAIVMCGDENSSFCSKAIQYGAMKTILVSMQKFNDNATLQAIGCQAMRVLIQCDPATFSFKSAIVVNALSKFGVAMHNDKVALHACDLIEGLSDYDELQEALIDAGALEALVTVIRTYKGTGKEEHDKIREQAKNAIKSLLTVVEDDNTDEKGN